jgi:hypothetical protein
VKILKLLEKVLEKLEGKARMIPPVWVREKAKAVALSKSYF